MKSILIFALLVCGFSSVESDLASDRAALITLRNAVGGRSLLWNLTTSPCSWVGVFCDQNRTKVIQLRVPGMGLSGQLPSGLGNLSDLQTLSLRFNALSGPIPADIGNLRSLRNLYLQENFFSGEIPESLFGLEDLVRLNLAHNNFSGDIPSGFNRLTRLATLFLEQNNLTGKIPNLNLPLVQFNVSFNNLHGEVPKRLAVMPATAFEGNTLCGGPLVACKGKKLSGGAIAGIVIGGVVLLLIILMILICLCRRRGGEKEGAKNIESQPKQSEVEVPRQTAPAETANVSAGYAGAVAKAEAKSGVGKNLVFFAQKPTFDLDDLLRASAEVLGKGTFGTAYKASLEKGMVVAVKRLKEVNVPEKEFCEKIEAVGKMNHENLVPLIAYYYSRDEKLLVYDYMPMGSLSALLHGNRGGGRTPLNWETRSGIALGAARGIAYIHSQGSTTSHGNIKSSNILLTNSFAARVSDFGLAHLAGTPTPTPNRLEGYRAPEVTDARKVSQKADVYSFGVLLLEMLTGKPPTQSLLNEDGVDLPRWVQSVVKEEWTAEVFDLELLRYQNVEEEMVQLLQLAIDCTAQYPDTRPTMADVRTRIEEICQSSSQKHIAEDDISDVLKSPQQPSS